MRRLVLICGLALLISGEAAGGTLRCDGALVGRGDRTWGVERLCGEPDLREPIEHAVLPFGRLVAFRERWYYNPGPLGLVRIVNFREGRVDSIDSGGRGYREFPGSRCPARLIRRNMTRMELLGECGEPDARQVLVPGIPPYRSRGTVFVTVSEEWLYEFGPGRLSRIVTLERGRVTRVETGRRNR